MKHPIFIIIASMFLSNAFAADNEALKDDTSRLSYSVGYQIGFDFKRQQFELRPDILVKGIEDALAGDKMLMTAEEMRQSMAELGQKVAELKKKRSQQIQEYAQNNRDFLIENGKKPGVTTTDSGLQYRVIEEGAGEKPQPTDTVLVNYRGKLIDGTEFDSSYARNKPASFRVNQVIKGWTEALQLMPRGSHWQLFIPSELAYGKRGAGQSIPPESTVIFEVELISIQ